MKKLMDSVLRRYGTDAELSGTAGRRKVKVFFSSINSTSWQNMQRVFSPLGEVPQGQYICVLPADIHAAAEDSLWIGDRIFLLRRIEPMDVLGETVYSWCLCVEKGDEDRWGMNE